MLVLTRIALGARNLGKREAQIEFRHQKLIPQTIGFGVQISHEAKMVQSPRHGRAGAVRNRTAARMR